MKKFLSIMLTVLMLVTMIPFTPVAFAADDYAVVDNEAGTVTIDGTLGGKTTATEDDVNTLVEQLKGYVDSGITTIIVTGSEPALYNFYGIDTSAVSAALYYLADGRSDSPYCGTIDLILPDVTEIVDDEFNNTFALNSITLPKVTKLGDLAFYACRFIQTIAFGSVVTDVEEGGGVMFHMVGYDVGGCDLVLNCGQMDSTYIPDIENNTWTFRYENEFKSITLTHTEGTAATCTELAVCSVCGESYGELAEHTAEPTYAPNVGDSTQHDATYSCCGVTVTAAHNYKSGTPAGACVCGEECPHSNFDAATGNCTDCETSLAIAKIETGETTTYYQTADDLRTAIENNYADQVITLLADLAIKDTIDVRNSVGTKNTLDLNGHTLICSDPIMGRILLEYGELEITGTGSINIFMSANDEGTKIVVGSGVTLNNSLRSAYGGVLELTNATIPEAGLNVILYSDYWDPTTYNVSDVLKLPADYYFFVDGKAVSGYSGETEGTVLKHAEHSYTYTDNGDGTHDMVCTGCGYEETSRPHTIENHVCTACGAIEITVSFNAGDYKWKTGDQINFVREVEGIGIDDCVFTATVAEDGTVTWTADKPFCWYGEGEQKLFAAPNNGWSVDYFVIPEDQSTSAKLDEADLVNGMWVGTPTTDTITFNMTHRMAKVTVNYEFAEGVTADISELKVYSIAQICRFSTDDWSIKLTSAGQLDVWVTPYLDGNQFTAFIIPETYATGEDFIKIILSDGTVYEVKMNKAVTFEDGGEYNYKVVITADGAYLTCADECTFEYTDNGDGTHDMVCTGCGYVEVDNEAHSGGTATCTEQAKCEHCGASYGDVDKNNHDETVAYVNGFCPNCDAYEPAELVDGVYQISNAGNLYWFADKVTNENAAYGSADAILTCDIRVNEGTMTESSTGARVWTPIGKLGFIDNKRVYYPYTGTFEGNGKTVSGLYFNDTSANFSVGLFSLVGEGGKVQNVGIADSYFCGGNNVGAVVGNNFGTVTGCYNTGIVSGSSYVGGVVSVNDGTVTGCYNTGTVSGTSSVGGVVGDSDGIVTDCHNTGAVSGSRYVGGVVGYNKDGTVDNCYNTGTVTGGRYVGGVAGYNNATVTGCYFDSTVYTGDAIGVGSGTATNVEGKSTEQFAGGEVAYLLSQGENGSIWGQDLDNGKPVQTTPTFNGAKVYCGYTSCGDTVAKYTNDETISAEKPDHTQKPTFTVNGDGTHSAVYPCCGTTVTEEHDFENDAHQCVCGKMETFTVSWFMSGSLMQSTSTYGQEFTQTFTVPENTHLRIDSVYLTNDASVPVNYTYENGVLTIAATDVPAADVYIDCDHNVLVTFHANGGEIIPEEGYPQEGSTDIFPEDGSYWTQEWNYGLEICLGNCAAVCREGYTFVDWRDASGQVHQVIPGNGNYTLATEDMTFYAQWQCNHTIGGVVFRDNGNGTHNGYCGECDELLGNYVEHPHNFGDNTHKCVCGYACPHDSYTNSVCDKCGYECPHEWGEGVLTRPTFESEGYYTYTCTLCGEEKTETAEEADTTALNDAYLKVTEYIDNDTLTQEALNEIHNSYLDILKNNGNIFDEFGFVRGDLVEEDQPAIDAITEALEKIIADADEKIASGEYAKADYTEIDEAIDDIEEKLASENVTDEGKAELEEIKKQLEEMKADENTSAADVAELEKALEDYEEELDKGIEDGTLVEVDVDAIADDVNKKWAEKLEAEGLLDEYEDFINNQKATDEAMAAVDEINDFLTSLEGTVAENAENIAKLNEMLDSLLESWENCLRGTHNFKDYEITSPAKCGKNAVETGTCWFCGETDEREVEGTALEHVFGKYTSNGDATCEADGTKTAECIHGCGTTDTVADEGTKLSHVDEDGDKLCDDCQSEIIDTCPDCGRPAHEDTGVPMYICIIISFIRLVISFIKAIS